MDTTTLNIEYLTKLGACKEAIQFIKRNNLEHFPVSRINEIEGDNSEWVKWIKNKLNSVREYDTNGNLIHHKKSDGFEEWWEYDSNGNMIHYKNSNGYECWNEYDPNGNLIHHKDSDGYECWHEYDSNGNEIHHKNSYGSEYWKEYDANGNLIHYKNSNGSEYSFHTEYYPSGQLKRYGNMILPELDNDSPTCYNNKTNGEVKMTNRTSKTTRYAVISRNTGKVLKNAPTREVARQWKRDSGKNGLGILDRNSGVVIS